MLLFSYIYVNIFTHRLYLPPAAQPAQQRYVLLHYTPVKDKLPQQKPTNAVAGAESFPSGFRVRLRGSWMQAAAAETKKKKKRTSPRLRVDVGIIRQRLQSVSGKRMRWTRKWAKSNKSLPLYFPFYHLPPPPSPSQSTMAKRVSRLACSTIRKGITFTHFPPSERESGSPDENVSANENFLSFLSLFFDEPVSDWSRRKKRLFCAPPVNISFGRRVRFAHGGGGIKTSGQLITNTKNQKAVEECFCLFRRPCEHSVAASEGAIFKRQIQLKGIEIAAKKK